MAPHLRPSTASGLRSLSSRLTLSLGTAALVSLLLACVLHACTAEYVGGYDEDGKLQSVRKMKQLPFLLSDCLMEMKAMEAELSAQSHGSAHAKERLAAAAASSDGCPQLGEALRKDDIRGALLLLASGKCKSTESSGVRRVDALVRGELDYETVATDTSRFFSTDLGVVVACTIGALYVFYPFFSPMLKYLGFLWLFHSFALISIVILVILMYLFVPAGSPAIMESVSVRTVIVCLAYSNDTADAPLLHNLARSTLLDPQLIRVIQGWLVMSPQDRAMVRDVMPLLLQNL
eukprot:TRINITY_DN8628_c2_g1_i1.p1 TRINITY_DN8628_c2_g1~~TRINITY_DN8628_c2_g1_i1.p1  ORF type:complete len:291 (+),score=80.43 TRINITY_DN8628_c2_g1_i1:76-948(+)